MKFKSKNSNNLFHLLLIIPFSIILILITNAIPVKGVETSYNYYPLTEDTSYLVENLTDETIICSTYKKDSNNKLNYSEYSCLDEILFDNNDNLKEATTFNFQLVLEKNQKAIIGTSEFSNHSIKIPTKCKVTKLNTPFWNKNLIIKKVPLKKSLQLVHLHCLL